MNEFKIINRITGNVQRIDANCDMNLLVNALSVMKLSSINLTYRDDDIGFNFGISLDKSEFLEPSYRGTCVIRFPILVDKNKVSDDVLEDFYSKVRKETIAPNLGLTRLTHPFTLETNYYLYSNIGTKLSASDSQEHLIFHRKDPRKFCIEQILKFVEENHITINNILIN